MKKYFSIPYLFFQVLTGSPLIAFNQVVNMNGGVNAVADGNISIVIDQGGIINNGVFKPGNSTVYFTGGATTAISGSQPTTFYNLIFQGTGTKLNAGNASVISTIGVQGTTVFDADGTLNDKSFTILSSDTATGRVDILTTGNIIGDVRVERFINTGTGAGQHAKSWQFLATPTSGQSYFQSWQEGGLTPAGYGTWLTGTGIGFDATTVLPSLKFYNAVAANWIAVTNTTGSLQNKLGYMLFVRGDRTVTTFNGTPNNTNMRSKGVLFTPLNPPPAVPVAANQFQSFGNPYASRIEFNKVFMANTAINDVYYAWDPKLNGSYNYGGYQTISGVAGYIPTAGNATAYYPAGIPAPFIESGQAVFVQGNGTGGNINFNENCKASGSRLINKGQDNHETDLPAGRQFLFTTLFTNTSMIADGNIVAFENGLGNELNNYDAKKILNAGENFGIKRNEILLAVEARDVIGISDTIFYHMQNLRQQTYELRFAPVNMPIGVTAIFIDRFLNSHTMISLTDSSFINFSVGTEPGSNAVDRFMLVFRQAIVVPVKIIEISANRNSDQTNQVNWKVENEINLDKYMIERSNDGSVFNTIDNILPTANNGGFATYLYRDERPLNMDNFYRIKAISNNGQIQYSKIVKVEPIKIRKYITVIPNPVVENKFQIAFINQQKGNYIVQLFNISGQLMYSNTILISQDYQVETIIPEHQLASGTYQLVIIKEDGSKLNEQVIVK